MTSREHSLAANGRSRLRKADTGHLADFRVCLLLGDELPFPRATSSGLLSAWDLRASADFTGLPTSVMSKLLHVHKELGRLS